MDEPPTQGQLPISSPPKSRLSRLSGKGGNSSGGGSLSGFISRIASSAGGSHRGYSSIGEADTPESGEAQTSPLGLGAAATSSVTVGDVYSSLQRGISSAGGGVARFLSQGVSRLSSQGSGYERVSTENEGLMMIDNPLAEQRRQLDGGQAGDSIGISPSAATLDFSQDAGEASGVAEVAPYPDNTRSISTAQTDRGDAALSIPHGLGRIRTRRTSRQSASGAGQPAAAAELPAGHSGPPAPTAAALTRQQPTADGCAGGPGWRTRADYQASLQSGTPPVLEPHLLQQAKGWRSPSEPGQKRGKASQGNGRQTGFPETPNSGTDPSNR